jgi:hypothetical protein
MHGEYKMPGGKLVVIDLDVRAGRLAAVQLSGDFFLEPETALQQINSTLEGMPQDASEADLVHALDAALGEGVMMYGLSTQSIAIAVHRALNREAEA